MVIDLPKPTLIPPSILIGELKNTNPRRARGILFKEPTTLKRIGRVSDLTNSVLGLVLMIMYDYSSYYSTNDQVILLLLLTCK